MVAGCGLLVAKDGWCCLALKGLRLERANVLLVALARESPSRGSIVRSSVCFGLFNISHETILLAFLLDEKSLAATESSKVRGKSRWPKRGV